MDLTRSLRYARRRAGLSQRALAERVGVQRSVVGSIESGAREAGHRQVVRLLEACGCTLQVVPLPDGMQVVPLPDGLQVVPLPDWLPGGPPGRLPGGAPGKAATADASDFDVLLRRRPLDRLVDLPDGVTRGQLVTRLLLLSVARIPYVVVGSLAERLWGAPGPVTSVAVCVPTGGWLGRAAVAGELAAEGSRRRCIDGRTDMEDEWGMLTAELRPAGTEGFDDLRRTAGVLQLDGERIRLASIEDLIRVRRAEGGHPSLERALVLERLLHRIDRWEQAQARGMRRPAHLDPPGPDYLIRWATRGPGRSQHWPLRGEASFPVGAFSHWD